MAVVGGPEVGESFLICIQLEWKCSAPEFVKEGAWVKFAGSSCPSEEINSCWAEVLHSRSLSRHPGVICKSTPSPGVLDEELESEVSIQDVRAAQGIVGELLWLSCRTRPDLSFGVSWMGRMVTRAPRRVCCYGEHMLGYLKSTMTWHFTTVFAKVGMEKILSWLFPGQVCAGSAL